MTAFLKTLPQTLVGAALLASVTILGYTGHLNHTDTVTSLWAFIGLLGGTGLYVLASQFSNVNALPHLIVGLGLMGSIVALGVHNVLNSTEIQNFLALIITGTAGGGVAAGAAVLAAQQNPPPPADPHVAS